MKKNPRFLCGLLPLFFCLVGSVPPSDHWRPSDLGARPIADSTEADYKIANFPFQSGETTLPALTVHYTTSKRPPMYMSTSGLVQHPAQWTAVLGS